MGSIGRRFAVLLTLAMAACAAEPVIRTDFDQTADFSRYRTFGFEPRLGTDPDGYSSILTQRLKAAVARELTARGYVEQTLAPDLQVDFYARLQDKVRVSRSPFFWPGAYGMYGYRDRTYGSLSGYGGWTDVDSYTQGTLDIDLIDRARRQLVWQGVAASEVDEVARVAPSAEEIDRDVARIFAAFPFRAATD